MTLIAWLAPMKCFLGTLQRHAEGFCNYAQHRITTMRLESGNVVIGLIRKRAGGLPDTVYFKLKIHQIAVRERPPGPCAQAG